MIEGCCDSADVAATMAVGAAIASRLRAGDVLLLEGTLGTGKSTLVRGLLAALGFDGEVASPTFPIMLTYEPPDCSLAIAHCDFYRLDSPDEARELGLSDWLMDGAVIAEWPAQGPDWLRRDALFVHMEMAGEGRRRLTATGGPSWKERWPTCFI